MTSKKYTLLAGLGCLIASTGFSQVSPTHPYTAPHPLYGTYSVTDSNYYSGKRLQQHNDFMVGTSDYPAKPRDMWELGIKGGSFLILGDMPANPASFGFGGHIRKSLGHVMSLRLEYVYGVAKGESYNNVGGWNPNYKTTAQELSLQALFNIHNIRFYKDHTSMTLYGIAGLGVNTWRVKYNSTVNVPGATSYDQQKDVVKQVRDAIGGNYDASYYTTNARWSKMFAGRYGPTATAGLGIAFRLSDRVNLAIEDRLIVPFTDMYDGYSAASFGNKNQDFANYASIGLNFNLGNKSKRVEPLYWLNPLNYAYGELRRVPEIILPDSDGDGVTDQFDQEQTPAGCPVDTHGVSRDTDGDGVPDCKDKELVTPTYCQPVNADGVGKCPCPEGCGVQPATECATLLGALPSVHFANNSNTLSADAQSSLATVASKLRANPNCKVVVVGYCAATKKQQQLSWDHVNKVITHLQEKEGISGDRFIFSSGQEGGDCNTVDIRAAAPGEDGPNTVAPPHPNLRKK
ncbi:OmpA family protein [Niabella soli]|uniref:OmpA family protein n=1 Tax=Niabella soli TaxID=446683 RepID=UPI0002499DBA|nr:OmpA family protein [Niabella soli]